MNLTNLNNTKSFIEAWKSDVEIGLRHLIWAANQNKDQLDIYLRDRNLPGKVPAHIDLYEYCQCVNLLEASVKDVSDSLIRSA